MQSSSWRNSIEGRADGRQSYPSAFLDDDEVVAEYLTAALEDPNPDVFLAAVGHVAKARGMSAIAERAGLGRESLYKALAPGAKPRYVTVLKVLQSLGVKLTVSAPPACLYCSFRIVSSTSRIGRLVSISWLAMRLSRGSNRRTFSLI